MEGNSCCSYLHPILQPEIRFTRFETGEFLCPHLVLFWEVWQRSEIVCTCGIITDMLYLVGIKLTDPGSCPFRVVIAQPEKDRERILHRAFETAAHLGPVLIGKGEKHLIFPAEGQDSCQRLLFLGS